MVVAVAIQNGPEAGIDEADEPRWRLLPEPGYRAISGIVGRGHTGGTVDPAASYSPLVIAEAAYPQVRRAWCESCLNVGR